MSWATSCSAASSLHMVLIVHLHAVAACCSCCVSGLLTKSSSYRSNRSMHTIADTANMHAWLSLSWLAMQIQQGVVSSECMIACPLWCPAVYRKACQGDQCLSIVPNHYCLANGNNKTTLACHCRLYVQSRRLVPQCVTHRIQKQARRTSPHSTGISHARHKAMHSHLPGAKPCTAAIAANTLLCSSSFANTACSRACTDCVPRNSARASPQSFRTNAPTA